MSEFIDTCILGQESTLAERRRARRVDCYDKIPLVCKDVRVPPRGPPVIPCSLRAWKRLFQQTSRKTRERRRTSMDEKQSRPLLVVALLPPVRLDNKPVHLLPFGSFEVKVLWRSQRFPDQGILGEGGDLFGCDIPLEVALGLGQVGFEIVEITDKEHVVRSLQRGAREYQPAVWQDLDGADCAAVSKRLGGNILGWERWVSRGFVGGIRNREDKELIARMITSGQVKKVRVLGELRYINACPRKTTEISGLTASSSADRSQDCVSV